MSVRFIHDSLSGGRPAPEDITAHNMRPSSTGKGVATIWVRQVLVRALEAEVDLKMNLRHWRGLLRAPETQGI